MQLVTFVSVALVAVMTRGMLQRLLILVGLVVATVIYAVLTNGLGLGKPIDLSGIIRLLGLACRALQRRFLVPTRCC